MAIKLNSYRPLCINEFGREAIVKYGLPPFIDSSCRRDPDLQNPWPSTTASCRGPNFAPHLKVDDLIVYMTRTGDYGVYSEGFRVLTAVLKVVEIYANHETAAAWYNARQIPLPGNCMVPGNLPQPWDHTAGVNSRDFDNVAEWDAFYLARITKIPVFVRTEKLYCNIQNPPVLSNAVLVDIFGKIPRTQTPPDITRTQFEQLMERLHIRLKPDTTGQ